MFSSGSLSITQPESQMFQPYPVESPHKRAPSEPQPTVENGSPSAADAARSQTPRPLPNLDVLGMWERDGYQTVPYPSLRKFCGHTTCAEDACLFQVRQADRAAEPKRVRGGPASEGGHPHGADYLTGKWPEYLWDRQGVGSPARVDPQPDPDDQEGDALTEIDHSLRQLVDEEIESFRCHLHNLLSHQHHQYRHVLISPLSPENDQGKDQRTVCENLSSRDATYACSPMNTAEQRLPEESSSSSFSMQDDETSQLFHPNDKLESEVDSLMVQLLTSACQVSHTLRRQEYTT